MEASARCTYMFLCSFSLLGELKVFFSCNDLRGTSLSIIWVAFQTDFLGVGILHSLHMNLAKTKETIMVVECKHETN